jgi:hypothetical protein
MINIKSNNKSTIFLFSFLILCTVFAFIPDVSYATQYVNSLAPGPIYNGDSWLTAYKTIQEAIDDSESASGNHYRDDYTYYRA